MAQAQVFNANTMELTVSVNGGPQHTVAAANGQSFAPGALTGGGPSFQSGSPSPDSFGYGANVVTVAAAGSEPHTFHAHVPHDRISSLQLYLFWSSRDEVRWLLLLGGRVVASGG
jgi:hypothetical protein